MTKESSKYSLGDLKNIMSIMSIRNHPEGNIDLDSILENSGKRIFRRGIIFYPKLFCDLSYLFSAVAVGPSIFNNTEIQHRTHFVRKVGEDQFDLFDKDCRWLQSYSVTIGQVYLRGTNVIERSNLVVPYPGHYRFLEYGTWKKL